MTIDENGVYRAAFTGEMAIVGWFLEQDVQSSVQTCQSYIKSLEAVEKSQVEEWKATGNAFTIIAGTNQALIQSEFSDESLILPTCQLIKFLGDWLSHISANHKK
jgi:uncharacterized protein YacL (UPF0231 family)